VYGYPLKEAASVALLAASLALEKSESVRQFRFVLFHEEEHAAFARALLAFTTHP
jgi:O-acetyl-ADP-ribose deacetylase (regulator of RNase III)